MGAAGRVRELEQGVRDLKRLLGSKTMEVEILEKARRGPGNNPVSQFPSPPWNCCRVTAVTDTLRVVWSDLIEQLADTTNPR